MEVLSLAAALLGRCSDAFCVLAARSSIQCYCFKPLLRKVLGVGPFYPLRHLSTVQNSEPPCTFSTNVFLRFESRI